MIGSVKLIEGEIDNEPMKVPIAILWPQKPPLDLRARNGSSRKLAQQTARDYTPADKAAFQSAINGFGPLYYLVAGLQSTFSNGTISCSQVSNRHNSLPQQLITVSLPLKRPGISILVLKETSSLKAPIDRAMVIPRTMRESHLPLL